MRKHAALFFRPRKRHAMWAVSVCAEVHMHQEGALWILVELMVMGCHGKLMEIIYSPKEGWIRCEWILPYIAMTCWYRVLGVVARSWCRTQRFACKQGFHLRCTRVLERHHATPLVETEEIDDFAPKPVEQVTADRFHVSDRTREFVCPTPSTGQEYLPYMDPFSTTPI